MAWDSMHKLVGSNGQVTMTPGYLSETITLGNNTDATTSHLPYPVKSDFTILVILSDGDGDADMSADTYLQVEHSFDGTTYVKRGDIEVDAIVSTDDISTNMAKIGVIDVSRGAESDGMMFMYKVDTHGMSPYTRFTIKANGIDESGNSASFYIIPHF
tara:strand:- start:1134 stop:1607 length:474 start_codon:yes stop_codon:yes gene_type:complete